MSNEKLIRMARDWQAIATREAAEFLGTPEGAARLVEAKRYGLLADALAQQPQGNEVTDAQIEALAIEYEAFGFGAVDARGLTTHGFNPDGLRSFARALIDAAMQKDTQ